MQEINLDAIPRGTSKLSQEVRQQIFALLYSLVALACVIAAIKCKGECSKYVQSDQIKSREICCVGLPSSFTQNFTNVTIS